MENNELKHTPGPWEYRQSHPDSMIKDVFFPNEPTSKITLYNQNNSANAKLIAAAPELLEALHGLVTDIEGGTCDNYIDQKLLANAKSAIAKATA